MTRTERSATARAPRRFPRSAAGRSPGACAAVAIAAALVAGTAAAGEGRWTLQLEPMAMDVYGHDQHVLTIHRIDLAAGLEDSTAVTLDTEAGAAYRFELQYRRGQWGWGADFFWFNTAQGRPSHAAAGAGGGDAVAFEVADRRFTSTSPGEALFYSVLEDTDLAAWTFDLYGIRTLAEKPQSGIHLQLGLRVADFDNDYRAVVGIEGVGGTRIDASSNYGQMFGPILGLAGDVRRGRNQVKATLAQSVIFGTPVLVNSYREFVGPSGDMPDFVTRQSFFAEKDVAIPITELRFKWTYRVSRFLHLGLGANASAWWDVPVPPGVIPVPGGDQTLHENTLVFFGGFAALELAF